ncbi:hypothetical protein HD554DRAFT_2172917 [Boletus coccyginus]|nr:hypothetical protein HD554DRAFT_2172917 [Boletus coccyginus]
MPVRNQDVPFLPARRKLEPPTKLLYQHEGDLRTYLWYITEDEYLRLNQIFVGHDFQETGMGGTKVIGLPVPCEGCGKYTEFIDWIWTALRRGVHSREFMFNALKHGRQGGETMHDVYCSECGLLTPVRSRDNAEGGAEAPTIDLAKPLDRSKYDLMPLQALFKSAFAGQQANPEIITWGTWWLDNTGSTAAYRARIAKDKAETKLEGTTETTSTVL